MGRERAVALGGVLFVIKADARQVDGLDRGEKFAGDDNVFRDAEVAEDIAGDCAG